VSGPISPLDLELDTLHRRQPWPIPVVIEADRRDLYQYTPSSDFSVTMRGFPVLILEVCSDPAKMLDKNRMQLQASCLVRLGNALCKEQHFVVRAIYLNDNYRVTEYTFFQGNDPVIYFNYCRMTN
jgi:hypothetical protein